MSVEDRFRNGVAAGTPVIPQASEGEWTLVQVTGGPAGWIHSRLLGRLVTKVYPAPAARRP